MFANHIIVFLGAATIVLFVLAQSLFFLRRAYNRAIEIGMQPQALKKAIISSGIFTVAPALAILLGVFALMPALGTALPWVRLSIIGALTYETAAAQAVLDALGRNFSSLYSTLTAAEFVTIVWVMTLGVLLPLVLVPIFVKPLREGIIKLEQKDKKWSEIFLASLFMGMISTFLGMVFKDINNPSKSNLLGWVPVFVLIVSAFTMAVIGILIKKCKFVWLTEYALPISMLVGMVAAVPITQICS